MIPYIELKTIVIGPITLQVWGILVALGFLFGARMGKWFAEKNGLEGNVMYDLVIFLMLAGIIGGRIGYVLMYNLPYFFKNPIEIFSVWDGGMSLFGGLIASILVGIWYLKKKNLNVWKYVESTFFAAPFGLWIGRMGCALIHDHPGSATNFILGVQYPDGIIRHDHGLYLSIDGFLMAMFFLWLAKKDRPTGLYTGIFVFWYGLVRFFLDFYRVTDVRYIGMTPGQYIGIAFSISGIVLLAYLKNNPKRFS